MRLNHPQGLAAENAALAFLLQKGCTLLARNWHCAHGEIDLIVEQNQTLIFVEVRYRKNRRFGGAAASLTPAKLSKLQKSAQAYLQQQQSRQACRIDAVCLEDGQAPQWLQNITG